jgi:hypothetical protein
VVNQDRVMIQRAGDTNCGSEVKMTGLYVRFGSGTGISYEREQTDLARDGASREGSGMDEESLSKREWTARVGVRSEKVRNTQHSSVTRR